MTNTFSQPEYLGKTSLEDAIRNDDVDRLSSMIIAAALEEEDRQFVEKACVRLSAHPNEIVRGNAILCFGHLARLFGEIGEEGPRIVRQGLTDPSDYVQGQAYAAAGDLKHFIGVEVRPPE